MYALIYDDRDLNEMQKRVISTHGTRDESDNALAERQNILGKRVYECNTRVVLTEKTVDKGDVLKKNEFMTWHPDEDVPVGELYSDAD